MSNTNLELLRADQRVKEAKQLLLNVIREQQQSLTGIRPADPSRIMHYKDALQLLTKVRGSAPWYPYLGSGIGKGSLVELMDGSVKYDFIGGIGVYAFGHSHEEIIQASIDAAISNVVMQGHLQQNSDQLELLQMLTKESGMDHCFLTTTGSMANENALKIAFQKNFPARRILAFERGFCGRTLAMTQITEKPDLRDGIPYNQEVDWIPFFDEQDPEGSTKRSIERLKHYLWRHPKEYALAIFELIQGEGGYYPGNKDFFRQIMQILKDNHIAILADEVQTFGRTSKLFAFQHFALEDLVDMVTIGKLSHICATLYRKEYNPKPGLLGQTFTGSTSAIHAAKTIIHMMINQGFFGTDGKNYQMHHLFQQQFEQIKSRHPNLVSGPYGMGAMFAFTPLNGHSKKTVQIAHKLFDNGVISFICGRNPTRIRFIIPVGVVQQQEIETVSKIVEETLLCFT